ncbi:HET-domain-containing protein, partial [Thozetella sp. PMI_491]
MRLLNVRTREFEIVYDPIPEYAILSHTWGEDEVTFDDMRNGYSGESVKIEGCCEQAAKDGLRYVWIDTICIDKSSSSELTEAINSMFAWYRDSTVCYAYLTDVPSSDNPNLPGSDFRRSRWFTRGWTLQELLAPEVIQFFSGTWDRIGEKLSQVGPIRDFMHTIEEITGIPKNCLSANWAAFEGASVAQKMSWAAGRRTTRKEDRAYSLLGIFGVHMPMLYGEGDNAFVRLQEEIMRTSDDRTILAWGYGITSDPRESVRRRWNKGNLFAASPDDFQHSGDIM